MKKIIIKIIEDAILILFGIAFTYIALGFYIGG